MRWHEYWSNFQTEFPNFKTGVNEPTGCHNQFNVFLTIVTKNLCTNAHVKWNYIECAFPTLRPLLSPLGSPLTCSSWLLSSCDFSPWEKPRKSPKKAESTREGHSGSRVSHTSVLEAFVVWDAGRPACRLRWCVLGREQDRGARLPRQWGSHAHSKAWAGCRGQKVHPWYRHPSKGEPQKGVATLPWSNHLTPQAPQVRFCRVESFCGPPHSQDQSWEETGYLEGSGLLPLSYVLCFIRSSDSVIIYQALTTGWHWTQPFGWALLIRTQKWPSVNNKVQSTVWPQWVLTATPGDTVTVHLTGEQMGQRTLRNRAGC